jgi:aspartyl-tRNA(Asn)/glutamyl-tRNA(Gln) amidotransferase subunit B
VAENSNYELVVGLEVHAQLQTESKLFCSDPTIFGAAPNTQVSPISLAHPGTLPAMNEKAVDLAIRLGLALGTEIVKDNFFARKNYFYPDLPKGYQISQHTAPVCKGGALSLNYEGNSKKVLLNRIHIEEDAGKSLHDQDPEYSCIDLNRAGVPLLEIVTEPCIHSAEDAYTFLVSLRKILRWTEVCDGNMEEGSMRCDANISIRKKGDTTLGKRVEIKNLNSIRNVRKAIEVEFERLVKLTEAGERILQETRSYDAATETSFSLRSKEEAEDYRYFPEPDLPAFYISEKKISEVKSNMPELPAQVYMRFQTEYGLSAYDAGQVSDSKETANYFEALVENSVSPKTAANWIAGPVRGFLNHQELEMEAFPLQASRLAELIFLVEEKKVSFQNAAGKLMLELIIKESVSVLDLATDLNLVQENDKTEIRQWVIEALTSMPDKVLEYKKGKKGLIGLFAGEVKKLSKGKADMQRTNQILLEELNK